jgi:hypothetical protein
MISHFGASEERFRGDEEVDEIVVFGRRESELEERLKRVVYNLIFFR